ncbi:hypothetical protein LTR10_022167 [Elasticomyces elasticus]|uniref:Uncharacterized protein n=1 Tax=Exophiala sideris TaxID=1016849 RepID=A0ABR0IVJ4_9EURO|nr:hypothetical protein LTR10_022167 [Elasticomyces elasticus]KAK5023782.1 hypothetical protein LTR13_011091 [Exophiala sideris]KAK5048861.1 hypothetical protein LTR69_011206 [Exophiala sideris]
MPPLDEPVDLLDEPVGPLDLANWDLRRFCQKRCHGHTHNAVVDFTETFPPWAPGRSLADSRRSLRMTEEMLAASKYAGEDTALERHKRKHVPCIWSHWCPICAMYVKTLV